MILGDIYAYLGTIAECHYICMYPSNVFFQDLEYHAVNL